MPRVNDKDSFVEKCRRIHGGKYDYSKFVYISAKTSSTITCPIHGDFEQKPDHHTRRNAVGCQKCDYERKVLFNRRERDHSPKPEKRISKEEFLQRFEKKHGDKFRLDLSEYSGLTSGKVKVECEKHGITEYFPASVLMSESGCRECGMDRKNASKTKSYDNLLDKVEDLYGGLYTLLPENRQTFKNRKSIIKLRCEEHGEFEKKAQKLLRGQACFRCRIESLIDGGKLPGNYNEKMFSRFPAIGELNSTLYYFKIDDLFKIGITTNKAVRRLDAIRCKGKSEIQNTWILEQVDAPLKQVYRAEQYLLKTYENDRILKSWSTEVFTRDIREGKTLKYFLDLVKDVPQKENRKRLDKPGVRSIMKEETKL